MNLPFARLLRPDAVVPPPTNGHHHELETVAEPEGPEESPPPPPPEDLELEPRPRRDDGAGRRRALLQPEDPDYYAVLGISPIATHEEVAIAYRRRAATIYGRRIGGGRATRNLKLLNAAYEVLGKPDRRRDYDSRRAEWLAAAGMDSEVDAGRRHRKPSMHAPIDRPRLYVRRDEEGGVGGLLVLAVVLLALVSAWGVFSYGVRDFAPFSKLAGDLGVGGSRTVIGQRQDDLQPLSATNPLKFATPLPRLAAAPSAEPTVSGDPFNGSGASVSNTRPAINSNITLTLKLVRNGQAIAGAPVYATVHYRTVNERWPRAGTVKTDQGGVANIVDNVGNATRGYEIKVDVFADVDGEPHTWSTAFTPQ